MHEISITVRDLFFFYQQFASLSLSLCVSVFFRTKHVLLSIWMCICWHSTMPFSFNVSFHSDISSYYCFVFFPLIPSFCSFCSMSGTSMLKTWQKPFGNMEKNSTRSHIFPHSTLAGIDGRGLVFKCWKPCRIEQLNFNNFAIDSFCKKNSASYNSHHQNSSSLWTSGFFFFSCWMNIFQALKMVSFLGFRIRILSVCSIHQTGNVSHGFYFSVCCFLLFLSLLHVLSFCRRLLLVLLLLSLLSSSLLLPP